MTTRVERFEYTQMDARFGEASKLALMPITLSHTHAATVDAVVDSGSVTNVLPYSLGVTLGLDWEAQSFSLGLAGMLREVETKAVLLKATVGRWEPVLLVFAWARTDDVRVLLGQTNFFREFDVCFHWARNRFEVRRSVKPRSARTNDGK